MILPLVYFCLGVSGNKWLQIYFFSGMEAPLERLLNFLYPSVATSIWTNSVGFWHVRVHSLLQRVQQVFCLGGLLYSLRKSHCFQSEKGKVEEMGQRVVDVNEFGMAPGKWWGGTVGSGSVRAEKPKERRNNSKITFQRQNGWWQKHSTAQT